MPSPLRACILRVLRVPPEPANPLGGHHSLRVFRAAPNYLKYKLVTWFIGQAVAVAGALVGLLFFHFLVIKGMEPGLLRTVLIVVEIGGLLAVAGQAVLSLALLRLDYELRWYKVTDRSLRIREGVWALREMTMTFANIQNVSISQGPVQRLLGIADLKVETAGGGGASDPNQQHALAMNMHTGYFRGVDNAPEIRDLIRERLRALRDTGLGDADDRAGAPAPAAATGASLPPAALDALRDLRTEAAALRAAAEALQGRRASP